MNAPRRSLCIPVHFAAAALAVALAAATPLTAQTTEPDRSYVAVVVDDNTPIRVGSAPSFYCIRKVKAGDMVRVIDDEKYKFVPVATMGPAFKGCFGYIRQTRDKAALLRIAPDRKSAVALGRVEIVGAFLDEKTGDYLPGSDYSWRPLANVPVEQPVQILETIELEKEIVYRVAMPRTGRAWIHTKHLRRATPEEAAAWSAALKAASAAAGKPKPADEAAVARQDEPSVDGSGDTPGAGAGAVQPALAQEEEVLEPVTEPGPAPGETATTPAAENEVSEISADEATAEAVTPVPQSEAAREAQEALDNLEAVFEQLRREPIETAEVEPLKQLYMDLVGNEEAGEGVTRFAGQRARQLELWSSIQRRKIDLARARARSQVTTEQTEAVRLAIQHAREYVAVGRLDASTIYDGRRLPRLFRLQDPGTGRTIAYVQPSEDFELVSLLGQLIGIAGEKYYDGGLRLNLIRPRQIDSLAPR